jgi:hypothetical protein
VLQIQFKNGKVINITTVEKCKPDKFAEFEIKKKYDGRTDKIRKVGKNISVKKYNDDLSCPARSRC